MKKKKRKDNPLKVFYEYEPTPDGEEKLIKIFEFLLSEENDQTRTNRPMV